MLASKGPLGSLTRLLLLAASHAIPLLALALPAAAATCGPFVLGVATFSQDDDDAAAAATAIAELSLVMENGTSEERRSAIEYLTAYGGAEALKLVAAALADEDPLVADEAQLLVPDLVADGALNVLLGRGGIASKNRSVRLRAAEALGRIHAPVNAQAVLIHVKAKNVELSRTLLWSLERLIRRDSLTGKSQRTIKSIRRLTGRGDNDRIRAAAMQALSLLDSHDSAISADNLRIGCGLETASCLMDTLQRLETPGFMGALHGGLSHENAAVRLRAIDVLMRGDVRRPTLDAFVARLETEPRAAIRQRLEQGLRLFTGTTLGKLSTPWKEHVRSLPPDWSKAGGVRLPGAPQRLAGGLDVISKLEPASDRVAILLDVSASFWSAKIGTTSLPDLVIPEIERLLGRVERTGKFYLMPFGNTPHPWTQEPVVASQANYQAAMKFLREDLGRTTPQDECSNIFAAIEAALAHEDLDRIVVISSSSFYAGEHASVPLMVKLLEERTRFRPAIFDFVLLGVTEPGPGRWVQLASSRGGTLFDAILK